MPQTYVLLAETSQGAIVAIKFSNRDKAEEFERRNHIDGHGVVPVITQTEAALKGMLA